jgi:hypothetical protein
VSALYRFSLGSSILAWGINERITEAVIDLRVELPENISLETLAEVQSGQETVYPKRGAHFQGQVEFAKQFDIEPTASQTQTGYVFSSNAVVTLTVSDSL